MNLAMILGGGGLLAVVARSLSANNHETPTLVGGLVVVWSIGLLLTGLLTPFLDYSEKGLLLTLSPLILAASLSWRWWYIEVGTVSPVKTGPVTRGFMIVASISALILVSYDALSILEYVRREGPTLALAHVRMARQGGGYYPPLLSAINPIRMLAAPLGWVLFVMNNEKKWRYLGLTSVVLGMLSAMATTGRSTFVITILWLWGISYYRHRACWGIIGTVKRLTLMSVIGGCFFIVLGMAIGKTGVRLSQHFLPERELNSLEGTALTLAVYWTGPVAALANSAVAPGESMYAENIVYPFYRVLNILGLPSGDVSRSLPYINIPFPFNTYTFMGPAYWYAGLPGGGVYAACVVMLLIWVENQRRRTITAADAVLSGYMVVCVVMSLSSDYFITAGFAYVVYAYYALARLVRDV